MGACPKTLGMWAGFIYILTVHAQTSDIAGHAADFKLSAEPSCPSTPPPLHPLTYPAHKHTHCQDKDFSKNYELKLEERSLEMFPRIG